MSRFVGLVHSCNMWTILTQAASQTCSPGANTDRDRGGSLVRVRVPVKEDVSCQWLPTDPGSTVEVRPAALNLGFTEKLLEAVKMTVQLTLVALAALTAAGAAAHMSPSN